MGRKNFLTNENVLNIICYIFKKYQVSKVMLDLTTHKFAHYSIVDIYVSAVWRTNSNSLNANSATVHNL